MGNREWFHPLKEVNFERICEGMGTDWSRMKGGSLRSTLGVSKITDLSGNGFLLLLDGRELFAPFAEFPWFGKAPISAILKVEQPQAGHLYWPDLDVDLAVESIEHPERFPLVSKTQ